VAQQRLAMRKIKEILWLRLLGGVGGARRIGLSVGCGKTAVAECLRRATAAHHGPSPVGSAGSRGHLRRSFRPRGSGLSDSAD
jgi:hypothetical protein